MKFLLVAINAKFIHSNPAVYSLAAFTRENSEKDVADCVEIAEYTINNQIENIIADIYKRKPDVAAFSCYIWNIEFVFKVTREIHKLLPDMPIWLGGPEVTYDAKKVIMEHGEIKGIMLGEGEETFAELLTYYEEKHRIPFFDRYGEGLKDIAGIAYKDKVLRDGDINYRLEMCCKEESTDNPVIFTTERGLTDLSKLPFLYDNLDKFENRIIYYESSRGCPFRCSYCLSSIDKRVRMRNLEIVKKELQFFIDNKVSQVKFVDRTFNCSHEHAMAIWNYIKEHDNGITNFHFEIAADILNEEELSVINSFRPGAVQMEIGVQSTNEITIKEIDRVMDVSKLRRIVSRIREGENVHIHLDLIAGLPYEDYESFKNSFNEVFDMKPEQLQLGFLKVLKGSKMQKKAKEYGLCYSDYAPYEVLYTKWISYEEILKLKQIEEMVELYYNSNQFRITLPILIREFDTPFDFFDKLADYYEEKDLFIQTPSRIYRYRVLLDFAEKYFKESYELIREALVIDVYLREKAKSRPDFAMSMVPKEKAVDFWKQEADNRSYLTEAAYNNADSRSLERMAHLEGVHYDFKTGKKLEREKYLLFNYQRKNPLNNEAWVEEIFL